MDQPNAEIYSDHNDSIQFLDSRPLLSMDEPGTYPNSTITIDETATGVGAHNWTWAASQDWCSGSGIAGDPYLIVIDLACNSSSPALLIESTTTNYFKIENSTFANWDPSGIGVLVNNSDDGVILRTDAGFNGDAGFKLQNSDNITLNDSNAHNNTIGLSFVSGSDNCTIYTSCQFYNNSNVGIYIEDSSDNNIYDNTIEDNTNHGIVLAEDSGLNTGNTIYNNVLRDNGVNGVDNSTTANNWDNGSLGNDWDTYSSYDGNDDGIGDVLYNVPGSAGADDNYPIFDDGTEPTVTLSDDDDADELFEDEKEREEFEINWYYIVIGGLISGLGIGIFVLVKKKIIRPTRVKSRIKSTAHTVKSTPQRIKTKAKRKKPRARATRR